MRATSLALVCIALCSHALAKAPSMRGAALFKEHLRKRADSTLQDEGFIAAAPYGNGSRPSYLNEKTQPFVVDGTSLPNITFDIGESYAGLLPVDETDKKLWFWFFPTDNPAGQDEILIWLNGGPGCSSLDGFFHENGPVVWMPGQFQPVRNTYGWTNLTNVVWIEQPVSTGYSQGKANATSEADVAAQFNGFWKNFVDTFSLHNKKVYVTGESYAGMYVPYIADAMITEKAKSNDTTYFDVNGIMIYDPSIGDDAITEQVPTMAFVDHHRQLFPFQEDFYQYLKNISSACGYDRFLSDGLTFPPKGPQSPAPGMTLQNVTGPNGTVVTYSVTDDSCDIFDAVFRKIFDLNPCFNIYQVSQICPLLWDVEGFPYSRMYLPPGYKNPYFNRTDVKTVLHAPLDANWGICNGDPFPGPLGDQSPPSGVNGGPLQRVVEATNNVIVGHGLMDMVLISNGTLLVLQNLTWNGAQGFSKPPVQPFYVPYHREPSREIMGASGVMGRWVSERGMTYVEVELAGHMIPQFTPSAAYRQLEVLLGRVANLSEVSSFTTQLQFRQPTAAQAFLGYGGSNVDSLDGVAAADLGIGTGKLGLIDVTQGAAYVEPIGKARKVRRGKEPDYCGTCL